MLSINSTYLIVTYGSLDCRRAELHVFNKWCCICLTIAIMGWMRTSHYTSDHRLSSEYYPETNIFFEIHVYKIYILQRIGHKAPKTPAIIEDINGNSQTLAASKSFEDTFAGRAAAKVFVVRQRSNCVRCTESFRRGPWVPSGICADAWISRKSWRLCGASDWR